jgi:hypothetical protein
MEEWQNRNLSTNKQPMMVRKSNVTLSRDVLDSLLAYNPAGYIFQLSSVQIQNVQHVYHNEHGPDDIEDIDTITQESNSSDLRLRNPYRPFPQKRVNEDGPVMRKRQRPVLHVRTSSEQSKYLHPDIHGGQDPNSISQLESNPFGPLGYLTPPLSATFHRPETASRSSPSPLPLHLPPTLQSTPPLSSNPANYVGIRHLNFPTHAGNPWFNMEDGVANPEALVPDFKFEKVLNQGTRRFCSVRGLD